MVSSAEPILGHMPVTLQPTVHEPVGPFPQPWSRRLKGLPEILHQNFPPKFFSTEIVHRNSPPKFSTDFRPCRSAWRLRQRLAAPGSREVERPGGAPGGGRTGGRSASRQRTSSAARQANRGQPGRAGKRGVPEQSGKRSAVHSDKRTYVRPAPGHTVIHYGLTAGRCPAC